MDLTGVRKIVILTGAGISAESGIKTFRDQNGLWENHHITDVASPEGFDRNASLVHEFYNKRREQLLSEEVKPNPAHFSLAKLEKEFKGEVIVVTQNVDNLHERAGTQNILHMHGELLKIHCQKSGKVFNHEIELSIDSVCDCCNEKGNLRPHIVWFGEIPLYMDEIEEHLLHCDLFISIGTSGEVYPAAMFVQIAKQNPNLCKTLEINLNETNISSQFDKQLSGVASEKVDELVEAILSQNFS